MKLNGRAQDVYTGLIQRGIPSMLAASAAGNFHTESRFDSGALGDKGTAFGYGQWRGDRRTALEQLAKSQGKDPRDHDVQLDHTANELKGPYAGAAKSVMAAKSPEEAGVLFAKHFERPAQWALDKTAGERGAATAAIFNGPQVPRDPIQNPGSILNTVRPGAGDTLPFNTGVVPQMVPPRIDPQNFSAPSPNITPMGPAGMALPGMLLNTPDPNAPKSIMASVPQFTRPQQESTLALGPGGSGGAAAMAPSPGFTPEAPKGILDNPDVTKGLEGIAKGLKGKEEAPMQITPTSNYGAEQQARMGQAQTMMAQLLANRKLRKGLI